MRVAFLSMLAGALCASPASAQIYAHPVTTSAMPRGLPGVGRERAQVDGMIHDGRRSGQLTRAEARSLRRESQAIGALQDRFADDGLSPSEQDELAARVEGLRSLTIAQRQAKAR